MKNLILLVIVFAIVIPSFSDGDCGVKIDIRHINGIWTGDEATGAKQQRAASQ